ncbi:MAG: hypothetical protein H6747_01965 [Deltaproteobacteria bacterium]|nr:hypothetical protein [Deltaproteobacteria bacterium]
MNLPLHPKNLLAATALALGLLGCGSEDGNAGESCAGPKTSCDGDVCFVTAPPCGPITESTTWTKDKKWVLQGGVFVGDGTAATVLTIEAGTQIFGETASKAFLSVQRGSQLVAVGSKDAPIVFTSAKDKGKRARGDWGGVVLNGRAPVNGCDTPPCISEGEGGSGTYGGDQPADNSGRLEYVRIEFAGHPITEDNELNGLSLQGVGAGTVLDRIQVHMAADDCVEFFGGTANFKRILCTGISDDNLDWTDGWVGKGQFLVAQQYEDAGDNGIEADNNGDANDALPRSAPMLANLTLIGSPDSEKSDLGILLREGTAGQIWNSVIVGWNQACFDVDHKATFGVAQDAGSNTMALALSNSVLDCTTTCLEDNEKDGDGNKLTDPFALAQWMLDAVFANEIPKSNGTANAFASLAAPFDTASPGFAPKSGSPLLKGAAELKDAFFEKVSYRGAIDPANDWTAGWTTSERN